MAKEATAVKSKAKFSPFGLLANGAKKCMKGVGKVAVWGLKAGLVVGAGVLVFQVPKKIYENLSDKKLDVHLINEPDSKGVHVSLDNNVVHTDRNLSVADMNAPQETSSDVDSPDV